MSDNHLREGSLAGEDGEFSPLEPAYGASADRIDDSVDQVVYAGSTDANALNPFHNETSEIRAADDGGKEDMFVDCPDEIEISESQQTSEEKENIQDNHFNESDSGINVQHLMTEMELLRDMHENSVAEKDRFAREYKERAEFTKELAHLSYQLKVLNEQQSSPSENAGGLVNHFQAEIGAWDEKPLESGASLHEMISECSRFLNSALAERLQSEGKVKELFSVLRIKDQEIDFLNAKVAELSKSSNFVQSNSDSRHGNSSESYETELKNDQHIEGIVNRILSSLSTTLHHEEFLEGSLTEKISNIEKSVTFLAEKYNYFLSEIDQLRACLIAVGSDLSMMDDIGTFVIAHDKILELKRNEENLYQNVSYLEDENRKLLVQIEKQQSVVENANEEIGKLSAGLEQEKNRYANTKEKLSMAVTKGKALVQQRDLLKQSLAEKTSQLEKCLIELQEKSGALEAAASMQNSLAEKDIILQKCGEILSEGVAMEELQPIDISEKLRWLADENKSLKALSMQFHKLTDALSFFTFPETVVSYELDACVRWLAESFCLSKEVTVKLQHEIAQTKEAANGEIDFLTTSFLAETLEKSYLQAELKDLRDKYDAQEKLQRELAEARDAANNEINHLNKSLLAESQEKSHLQVDLENLKNKFEVIVQKEHQLSLEKNQVVSMLLEPSGLANDGQQEVSTEQYEMKALIENCLEKIKEKICYPGSSQIDMETLERIQSLLYIRDQEMRLYKLIVEEDMLDRIEINRLSNELQMITQELTAVKDEKMVVQKSLEQMEEKCALLREKLSMAVKKGKGLFQERENLKGALNEKNVEIDRLKSELQLNLSTYNECQDQITKLSLEVDRISQLETSLRATQERADQLKQFLADSNSMLRRVVESIDGINIPGDLAFEDPAEKVKWFAGYLSEHEIVKMQMEQELRNVKAESTFLASELSEAQTITKSLEDALSLAENNVSLLLEEKKEIALSKANLEEDLQKKTEETSSHTIRFEEVSASKRALEDALSLSESNISRFMNERDIAVESRTLAEEQLQKLKDEFSVHISKLYDADQTIQSLEVALSRAQKNVSLLTEENSKVQIGRVDLDNEIMKIREEADSQVCKLADASATIKLLEDALMHAENNMKDLVQENKNAEQEILELNSKLKSCMEELAENCGSKQNLYLELSGKLSHLQLLLQDETLSTLLEHCFGKKFESLKGMDFLLREMRDIFQEMDSDVVQNGPVMEDASFISTSLSSHDGALNMEMWNDVLNAVDSESVIIHIEKMIERFNLKGKILADKVEKFSSCMDESIAALSNRFHITKDTMVSVAKYIKSLKQQVKDMETDKRRQEDTIASLESDIRIILSACTDATQELELNAQKNMSKLGSIHEFVKLDDIVSMELGKIECDASEAHAHGNMKAAEMLLLAARHNQDLSEQFLDAINKLTSTTEDMQNKLKETELTCHEVMEERDLYRNKILKLETNLESLQNSCHDMKLKLDDYQEKEDKLRVRETEVSSSLSNVQELENSLLLASQMKSILHKINEVEVPDTAFVVGDEELNDSDGISKLFYVIDSFDEYMQKVRLLSREKEELQSTIDKKNLEVEFLKKKIEDAINDKKLMGETMNELLELQSGLQVIVQKLGGDNLMESHKVAGAIWLLPLLDKLVMTSMLESESLKSKNEELGSKLLGTQRVVDDLSNKVKLLEDPNHARIAALETDQERGTSTASLSTQSEISEVQDIGALGKSNNIPLVPSAAHVRTMRKGSSDHLAIDIDSESERLIKSNEADEDKGHIFKSLNTSGLIPRQGRTAADRIDGIWVSGSRALMSHPRGRLGLIAYLLISHIWLLGTIL